MCVCVCVCVRTRACMRVIWHVCEPKVNISSTFLKCGKNLHITAAHRTKKHGPQRWQGIVGSIVLPAVTQGLSEVVIWFVW